ncbi:MAG: alpha/beta hydrolase, partial [Gemmataceae bacterium]
MSEPRLSAKIWAGFLAIFMVVNFLFGRPIEEPRTQSFHVDVSFDPSLRKESFTGRLYLMIFRSDHKTLQKWPNWFNPEPCFVRKVSNWEPGSTLSFDDSALGFPHRLSKLPKGTYTFQAVMDVNPDHAHFSVAPGNLYAITRKEFDPEKPSGISLQMNQVFKQVEPGDTDRVHFLKVRSNLVSNFHHRPTYLRAGVVLPESYLRNTDKKYPVLLEIPGFGGNHLSALHMAGRGVSRVKGREVLHVVLDPSCHHGHHVFADSANNGPYGRALIEELIPEIEKRFRVLPGPRNRILTGHSSGGWSTLWLQTTYPDMFAGCWSTAPDPVDFRDFQRINLYRSGENMFLDREGQTRPIARRNGKAVLFYRSFSDMEEIMGHGGQLASFEAVFSNRGEDGQPCKLWNRKTGEIDPQVAESW